MKIISIANLWVYQVSISVVSWVVKAMFISGHFIGGSWSSRSVFSRQGFLGIYIPITGKVYILVFHQTIYCRQMDNHLICPVQCCVNGVVINDTPKMCIPNLDNSTHSIKITNPLDPVATLHIPFILRGVTSCFCVRKPSTAKFADDDIPKLDMTYKSPEWDPGDPDWDTQEASTMDSRGQVHDLDDVIAEGQRFINLVSTSEQSLDFTAPYKHV